MYCSRQNCGIRKNECTDVYNCDQIGCSSRKFQSYHDAECVSKKPDDKLDLLFAELEEIIDAC